MLASSKSSSQRSLCPLRARARPQLMCRRALINISLILQMVTIFGMRFATQAFFCRSLIYGRESNTQNSWAWDFHFMGARATLHFLKLYRLDDIVLVFARKMSFIALMWELLLHLAKQIGEHLSFSSTLLNWKLPQLSTALHWHFEALHVKT